MAQHLLLSVRFHGDGRGTARFHGMAQGSPEWPPAPARLFQALVAGSARGPGLPALAVSALRWLEALPPPLIAAPHRRVGQEYGLFVPNNDADTVADPRDVSGIRTQKVVHPSLFSDRTALLYAWALPEGATPEAGVIADAAAHLYQLGRGVDMAWAVGEVVDDVALDARVRAHRGPVYRPSPGVRGRLLACPVVGSFDSLERRHRATKLRAEGSGRAARELFTNPPKARFASISYEFARRLAIFELRDRSADRAWPWALPRVVKLVEAIRDAAAARLRAGLPGRERDVDSTLIGRKVDGQDSAPIAQRVRLIPLPSIGSKHADHAVRRLLVEVPSGGSIAADDLEWAFSGLDWADPTTGEASPLVVTRSDERSMLEHYVGPAARWQSVTPAVLPESAKRRRIEPARRREEAKGSQERRSEQARAVEAVHHALRHAGIFGIATQVRVQREPFHAKGSRVEPFAAGTRFAKERLWHVELTLDRPIDGPLVIGDGRFLGLGVMTPVADQGRRTLHGETQGIFALGVDGRAKDDPVTLARALRRAVMALVQDELGDVSLEPFFSGHEEGGAKASSQRSSHLAFQWDSAGNRLLVVAPHCLERRRARYIEREYLGVLDRALEHFVELRAGSAGRFGVVRTPLSNNDALLASCTRWVSGTVYTVSRHAKHSSAHDALKQDVLAECARSGLPRPVVTVLDARGVPGVGLQGTVQLDFASAVDGPIALGRSRFLGGGLFVGCG